jgi:hypothetical protein
VSNFASIHSDGVRIKPSLGQTLIRKLLIAIDERQHQIDCFKEINAGLTTETRIDWESRVRAWDDDKSKPNPFLLDKTGETSEG